MIKFLRRKRMKKKLFLPFILAIAIALTLVLAVSAEGIVHNSNTVDYNKTVKLYQEYTLADGTVTDTVPIYKEKERNTVNECAEKLQENGVIVSYKSDFYQKFTVIDQSVVWYGSVNFLSFGTHEESIMRFENADIAGQLMDTVL
ncbi:MAG: hypothetical protein J6A53_03445 [Clostridia bacterium]|nr:hypothetical protein [Clostridia bacterium]